MCDGTQTLHVWHVYIQFTYIGVVSGVHVGIIYTSPMECVDGRFLRTPYLQVQERALSDSGLSLEFYRSRAERGRLGALLGTAR